MSRCSAVARPIARQLQSQCVIRSFTTSAAARATEVAPKPSDPLDLNPDTVLPEFEEQLIRTGQMPVGSRRRRVAIRTTGSMAFEQLPYQAFQEARSILAADRDEKLLSIQATLDKIAALQEKDGSQLKGGEAMKETKLASLHRHIEKLKILADINDPLVKKRFEDGLGRFLHPVSFHLRTNQAQVTNSYRRHEQTDLPPPG